MHRFIVIGGGAGGLELATRLGDRYASHKYKGQERVQVTLVDRNPTHIWKPLLHEVAAGSMDPPANAGSTTQHSSMAVDERSGNLDIIGPSCQRMGKSPRADRAEAGQRS